jgi:hypothetical protein
MEKLIKEDCIGLFNEWTQAFLSAHKPRLLYYESKIHIYPDGSKQQIGPYPVFEEIKSHSGEYWQDQNGYIHPLYKYKINNKFYYERIQARTTNDVFLCLADENGIVPESLWPLDFSSED